MAQNQLHRILRKATPDEVRRHQQIRVKTDKEFASKRKPVSPTRVILAKLRSRRELMGFSLADVAKQTGMTRSNLSRLEQNGENAKLETLQRYAAVLGCELVVDVRTCNAPARKAQEGAA
jgi:DNA-binding Xre family transcriptional regulator